MLKNKHKNKTPIKKVVKSTKSKEHAKFRSTSKWKN